MNDRDNFFSQETFGRSIVYITECVMMYYFLGDSVGGFTLYKKILAFLISADMMCEING